MSTNCTDCIKNERTGFDGLCDDCRLQSCPDCKTGRPRTSVDPIMGSVYIGCSGKCDHALVYGKDYQEAVLFWNRLK